MEVQHLMVRLLFVIMLAATFAQAQNRRVLPANLTLRQALDIAFVNSSTLREARANLEQASGRYQESRSALLPQVGVAARQGYLTMNLEGFGIDLPEFPRVLGPFGSMDARAFIVQDFVNIATLRSWPSYSSRRDARSLLVDNAREVVTLNVVSAYLLALRAKASRDSLSEQTKLANDLYQITADRARQGVSSDLDANRAKQQVNTLEQQRQESEQDYIAAKLNLANILQANITSDFDVSDPAAYGIECTVDPCTVVAAIMIQSALATRSDYRAAQAAVRAAELEIKSVEATRLPTFRVRADDGPSGTAPIHSVNVYSVTGSIAFPIFTGGRIRGQIRDAEGVLEEAVAALDKNRAQIETDVLTAMSGVEWALKQVQTSEENVGLSRQEVELTSARFSQGISDNTEVVNAQDRLAKADDARIRAQYTLGVARANLARATGGAEQAYRK